MTIRTASVDRVTGETSITLTLTLDPASGISVNTGVLFLDHMVHALCKHARWSIDLGAAGDSAMDPHHTVEDVGIAIGQALKEALGDRRGIDRYGSAYAPLDEALARVVVDVSGRPFLEFQAVMPEPVIGADFAASLVEEFWRSLAMNAGLTMHIDLLRARNSHHAAEAIFKAAAVALRSAVVVGGPTDSVPSTKDFLG